MIILRQKSYGKVGRFIDKLLLNSMKKKSKKT